MKIKQIASVLLLVLSSYIVLAGAHSSITTLFLMASSVALMLWQPLWLIPMLFLTSISSTFVVIPGLAGYIYYAYLLLIGSLLKLRLNTAGKISVAAIITFLYAVWLIVTATYSISGETEQAIKMLIAMIPIFIVPMFTQETNINTKHLFVVAVVFSGYVLLKLLFAPVLYVATVDDAITYQNMLNAQLTISERVNPNTLSQGLLLAYLIIYTIAVSARKWLLLIFIALPIMPMLMIGSRTAFVTMVAISVLVLLFDSKLSKKLKTAIILLAILGIPTILNQANQINDRLDMESIVEDDGSGRFDTWKLLMDNVVPNNPIMGVGYGRVNLERIGYTVDADNMYVDALSQIGIVGLVLLMLMLIFYLKPLWGRQDKNSRIAISLLLFVLIEGFGETIFDTFIFVFILLYAVFARENIDRKSIEK